MARDDDASDGGVNGGAGDEVSGERWRRRLHGLWVIGHCKLHRANVGGDRSNVGEGRRGRSREK